MLVLVKIDVASFVSLYISDRENVLLFLELFYSFWLATLLFPISRGKQVWYSMPFFSSHTGPEDTVCLFFPHRTWRNSMPFFSSHMGHEDTVCLSFPPTWDMKIQYAFLFLLHRTWRYSMPWAWNRRALVCDIFWRWSPGVFSGYSGFLLSFIDLMVQPIK